jgi:hypothetical protein
MGDQEEVFERELESHCAEYRDIARDYRKRRDDERGPSELETQVAVEELKKELESPEMVDAISIDIVPPEEVIDSSVKKIAETITPRVETYRANIAGVVTVKGYLAGDLSPNDPYIVVDSTSASEVPVIVNLAHPHWSQLIGSEGVLNYLRHCTYDAIAEWQARQKARRLDPNTIKLLKDKLLRIPLDIDMVTDDIVVGDPSAG